MRGSVVQIAANTKDARHLPIGTGFFVSDRAHVVTARHVVEQSRELSDERLLVGMATENTDNIRANWSYVDAEILYEDPVHDQALLQMSANPFQGEVSSGIVIDGESHPLPLAVAELATERPYDGEGVAVCGYPLAQT